MMKAGVLTISACLLAAVLAAAGAGQVDKVRSAKESKALVLDINRAGVEDFEKLPGIGPELARRIVQHRKKHGPYRRVEDLLAIRGMGPKKWRAIRPQLRVGSDEEKSGTQD